MSGWVKGIRMPAARSYARALRAGVRKPPRKEPAVRGGAGRSGIGASRPLPSVPTKVRLLNRLPPLDFGGGTTLLAPLETFAVSSGIGSVGGFETSRCP
jgi:hypothetical protein